MGSSEGSAEKFKKGAQGSGRIAVLYGHLSERVMVICFRRCDPWPSAVSCSHKHWLHTTVLDRLSVAEMEATEDVVEASTMESSRNISHPQTLKHAKFFVSL